MPILMAPQDSGRRPSGIGRELGGVGRDAVGLAIPGIAGRRRTGGASQGVAEGSATFYERALAEQPHYFAVHHFLSSYSARMPNREILGILREQTDAWNRGDGVASSA